VRLNISSERTHDPTATRIVRQHHIDFLANLLPMLSSSNISLNLELYSAQSELSASTEFTIVVS